MRLSLRYRLLVPLALLLLGDAAATAWAAQNAARSAERRLAEQQWGIARTLTEPRSTEPRSTFPLKKHVLEQMKGLSGAEFLFTHPTEPTESTFPDPKPDPPADVPTATQPKSNEEPTLGRPVTVAGREYWCLRLPLRAPHPNAGGNLYIFYPESLRRTAVADAVRPFVILGAGGLIAMALAVAFGSRLVRRVRDLDARTRLIAAGDFRPMPVPAAGDELRDLCEAVNDMARRLAAFRDELQRNERLKLLGQFSGGLAHQLRNAAAGARLAVEVFLTENPTADPEPLRVALRQLARIEANLRQFLSLGKPPTGACEPCELGQLIDQAVSLIKPQCQHAGTTVTWERPAKPCALSCDPTALAHLLGNVIGNAVEAAGPGGAVEVRLAGSGSQTEKRVYRIEVTDTGPGPPAAIAEKLFDPFVTGKDQGIGLGLAVAKQAVEAHNGTIRWERRAEKTVFVIELPGPVAG
jgi:signal transduction histidine kinase